MYNPKFTYTPIERKTVNGQRVYATPDGNALPSVTTILEATKPQEKRQALANWRKRVGERQAQQITTEAASRGTKMHAYLENFAKSQQFPPTPQNPFHRVSWHMADLVINNGLKHCNELWGVEVPLYYPGIYAGTTDCAGVHAGDESIIDFKQTNKEKRREWIEDYFLQLAAYMLAHNELHKTAINKGVIMMCVKPEIDEQGNLTSEPKYQEFIMEGTDVERYKNLWWDRVSEYYRI